MLRLAEHTLLVRCIALESLYQRMYPKLGKFRREIFNGQKVWKDFLNVQNVLQMGNMTAIVQNDIWKILNKAQQKYWKPTILD